VDPYPVSSGWSISGGVVAYSNVLSLQVVKVGISAVKRVHVSS